MSLGLIIEGIPLTGKTSLLTGLQKHSLFLNYAAVSKLIYSEDLTQRILEKDYNRGFLDKSANINLLMSITTHLQTQKEMLQRRGFSNHLLFILERFHLTHAAYYPYLTWPDVEPIDQILKCLNTKLILLTVDRQTFKTRLLERSNTGFMSYIQRYGSNKDMILDHYMQSQDHYLNLAYKSSLETKIIDSVAYPVVKVLENALDFWLKP